MANKQPQKAPAAAAILGWLLSLAAARGVQVPVDPGVLLRIDRGTLVRVLEAAVVTLSRPVVSGAAALMELLSRAVLLLLAVILCATPSKREVVLQRVRALLKEQVEVAVRLSLRMSPAPAPPQPLPELPRCGGLPNVLVVGAGGVGKSTLIGWLNARAAESRLELAAAEGMPSGRALEAYAKVRLGVVVWEAALDQPLGVYVQRYSEQMQAVVGNPSLPVVVVCNKTDVMPCPIPQLAELRETQPFIAVSAERAINLRHLWEMVQPTLPVQVASPPLRSPSTAGPAEMSTSPSPTQGGSVEHLADSLRIR